MAEFASLLPSYLAGNWHVQIAHTAIVVAEWKNFQFENRVPLSQSTGCVTTELLGSSEAQVSVDDTTRDTAMGNLALRSSVCGCVRNTKKVVPNAPNVARVDFGKRKVEV
jgi:hypothetical protein